MTLILYEGRARRLVRIASYQTKLALVQRLIYDDAGLKWETVSTRLIDLLTTAKCSLSEIKLDHEVVTTIYGLAVESALNTVRRRSA